MTLFPLLAPLRCKVTHAAYQQRFSNPVVISVELSRGRVGYGECIPSSHLTGETIDSVLDAVQTVYAPFLENFHPTSFPQALEAIEDLPWHDPKHQLIPAARAAVELALLDGTMRAFDRGVNDVVQWMGLPGFGTPGSLPHIRFSGVPATDDPARMRRTLRRMYWYGLRSFKIAVGLPGDREQVERAAFYLKAPLATGRASLRLDASGRWSKDEAIEWLQDAASVPIAAIEQPLDRGCEADLPLLHDLFAIPLVHDESLVTIEDGHRLIDLGVADGFNIGISKCGGLMPSLRLAALARREQVRIELGCMVGETSILSAAGLRFLQVSPGVIWAEGCLGTFLLRCDIAKKKSLRFGYGGQPPRVQGPGLGVQVDEARLRSLCEEPPKVINL